MAEMEKNFDKFIREVLSEELIFEFNTKWLQGILGLSHRKFQGRKHQGEMGIMEYGHRLANVDYKS